MNLSLLKMSLSWIVIFTMLVSSTDLWALAVPSRVPSLEEVGSESRRGLRRFEGLRGFLTPDSKKDYSYYLRGAESFFAQGKHAKALEKINKALSKDPNQAEAYSFRANIYEALGRNEDARADREHIGTLRPATEREKDQFLHPKPEKILFSKDVSLGYVTENAAAATIFEDRMYLTFRDKGTGEILLTSSEDGKIWSTLTKIMTGENITKSTSAPALTVFNNKLYLAFRSFATDNRLYLISSEDGEAWSSLSDKGGNPGGNTTSASPSLAVFGEQLYLAFKANDSSDHLLLISSEDGEAWSSLSDKGGNPGGNTTSASPSLAVFGEQLYLAFKANDSTNRILLISSEDGEKWSSLSDKGGNPSGNTTSASPSLAVFGEQLYLGFKANDSTNHLLFIFSEDGKDWSSAFQVGGSTTFSGPAMSVSPDGNDLRFWFTDMSNELNYVDAFYEPAKLNDLEKTFPFEAPVPNAQGVDLFTGSVVQDIPLGSIIQGSLAYDLNLHYHSGFSNYEAIAPMNQVGSHGWTLSDYPRIFLGPGPEYYFLDGQSVQTMELTAQDTYRVASLPGWKIEKNGTGFIITTDSAVQYSLELSSSSSFYHLSQIKSLQWPDAGFLLFTYDGDNLLSIADSLGHQQLKLEYGGGHLTRIGFFAYDYEEKSLKEKSFTEIGYTDSPSSPLVESVTTQHAMGNENFSNDPNMLRFSYKQISPTVRVVSNVVTSQGETFEYDYYEAWQGGAPQDTFRVKSVTVDHSPNDSSSKDVTTDFVYENTVTRGALAQANKVSVQKDVFGSEEFYFFNGQSAGQLFRLPEEQTDDVVTASVLRGLPYFSRKLSGEQEQVSSRTSLYEVGQYGGVSYAQMVGEKSSLDGVESETVRSYADELPYVHQTVRTVTNPPQNDYVAGLDSKDEVEVRTNLTFACKQYPNLESLNMLTPVYSSLQYVKRVGGEEQLSAPGSFTTWKNWGNSEQSNWDVDTTYYLASLDEAKGDLPSGFTPPCDGTWFERETVLARNPEGVSVAVEKEKERVHSVLMDSIYGEFPIVAFDDARVYVDSEGTVFSEAGYIGFDSFAPQDSRWSFSGGQDSDQSFSGSKSYMGSDVSVSAKTFSPRSEIPYVVSAFVRLSEGSTAQIGFKNGDTWSVSESQKGDSASENQWVYIQAIMPAPSASDKPTLEISGEGIVDSVYFGPINSHFQANFWDWENKRIMGTLGPNGQYVRNHFDVYGDMIGQSKDGVLQSLSIGSSSPEWNYWAHGHHTYDPNQPNLHLSLTAPEEGILDEFVPGRSYFHIEGNNMVLEKNRLVTKEDLGNSTATALFDQQVGGVLKLGENFAFYMEIVPKNLEEGQEIGFFVNDRTRIVIKKDKKTGQYGVFRMNGDQQAASFMFASLPSQIKILFRMEYKDSEHGFTYSPSFYIQGRKIEKFYPNSWSLNGGFSEFVLISSNPGGYFQNFAYMEYPAMNLECSDASSRQVQSLAKIDRSSLLMDGVLRGGDLQLSHGMTKGTTLTSNPDQDEYVALSYQPGFITSFDRTNMTMQGSVTDHWPADGDRPFSWSVQRDHDPLMRTQARGSGGDFTAGQNSMKFDYDGSQSGYFGFDPDDVHVKIIDNTDGMQTILYRDRLGIPLAKIREERATDNSKVMLHRTRWIYDDHQRLVKTIYPAAYDQAFSKQMAIDDFQDKGLSNPSQVWEDLQNAQWVTQVPMSSSLFKLTATTEMMSKPAEFLKGYLSVDFDKIKQVLFQLSFVPDSHHQVMDYDFLGQVTQKTDSDSGETYYKYNKLGQLRLTKDANGDVAFTKYDVQGRVIEEGIYGGDFSEVTQAQLDDSDWPNAENIESHTTFTYDYQSKNKLSNTGRLLSTSVVPDGASAGPSFDKSYTYDDKGRVVQTSINVEGLSSPALIDYDYNKADQVTQITAQTSSGVPSYDVTYTYDRLGRVTGIGKGDDPTFYAVYEYGNGILREKLNGSNQFTRTYQTNSGGMLTSIDDEFFTEKLYYETRKNGDDGYHNGQIASAEYTFKDGSWPGAPDGYSYEYYYAPSGWLEKAISSDPSLSIGKDNPIDYTANGNVLSIQRGSTTDTFTYDEKTNRLTQATINGKNHSYTYANNGDVTQAGNIGIIREPLNGMPSSMKVSTGEEGDDDSSVDFLYDSHNWRVVKTKNGESAYIHRDLNDRVLLEERGDKNLGYVYGPNGLIAIEDKADGKTYFILKDHQQSTRVVVDQDNKIVAYFNYAPFGELIAKKSSDSNESYPDSEMFHHRYTGHEFDPETGFYYFGLRYYDPTTARFLSPDPLHQFSSPYVYAENPLSFEDPNGKWFGWDDAIAMGAGAFIGGIFSGINGAIQGHSARQILKDIGVGAAAGAVTGEVSLYTGGLGVVASGAISGAVGQAVTDGISGNFKKRGWAKELVNIAGAGVAGGVTGGVLGKLSPAIIKAAKIYSREGGRLDILKRGADNPAGFIGEAMTGSSSSVGHSVGEFVDTQGRVRTFEGVTEEMPKEGEMTLRYRGSRHIDYDRPNTSRVHIDSDSTQGNMPMRMSSRGTYDLGSNNCATVASEVYEANGLPVPWLFRRIPLGLHLWGRRLEKTQKVFATPLAFDLNRSMEEEYKYDLDLASLLDLSTEFKDLPKLEKFQHKIIPDSQKLPFHIFNQWLDVDGQLQGFALVSQMMSDFLKGQDESPLEYADIPEEDQKELDMEQITALLESSGAGTIALQHKLREEDYELEHSRSRDDLVLLKDGQLNPDRMDLEIQSAIASFKDMTLKEVYITWKVWDTWAKSQTDVDLRIQKANGLLAQMHRNVYQYMIEHQMKTIEHLDETSIQFQDQGLAGKLESLEHVIAFGQVAAYAA